MEFKEFISTYQKMCDRSVCTNCYLEKLLEPTATRGFKNCIEAIFDRPEEAEEILTRWNNSRKFVSNKELFSELFNLRPWAKYIDVCGRKLDCVTECNMTSPCGDCPWLSDTTEIISSDTRAAGFSFEYSNKGGDEQ